MVYTLASGRLNRHLDNFAAIMMNKPFLWLGLASSLVVLSARDAVATPFKVIKTEIGRETCLKAAQARLRGNTLKLEYKRKHGIPLYDIVIAGNQRTMEFACDAHAGKIFEERQQVDSPEAPLFKAKAKIGVAAAAKIALAAHPGTVMETEFVLKADEQVSYEFDIQTDRGREMNVEVDAVTGRILDEQEELYQVNGTKR